MKKKYFRCLAPVLFYLFSVLPVLAQEVNTDTLQAGIFNFINEQRIANGQEIMIYGDPVDKAAQDQANYCSEVKQETPLQKELKKSNASLRVTFFGGIKDGVPQEIIFSESAGAKGKSLSDAVILDKILRKLNKPNFRKMFLRADMYYLGVGASLDPLTNKVYFCVVMGDINIINNAGAHSKDLDKNYKIPSYAFHWWWRKVKCKISCIFGKCDQGTVCGQYDDLKELYGKVDIDKGFYINENKLFLKESFKKYFILTENNIRTPIEDNNDRLIVSIIELSQFPCNTSYNISVGSTSQTSLEIGLRPITLSQLSAPGDLMIDKLPLGFSNNFEIGLKVVKYCDEKIKCDIWSYYDKMNRLKTYFKPVAYENLPVMLDTLPSRVKETFMEFKQLSFRIPFEKNKFDYKPEDIAPLIDSLNEPRFIIQNVEITGYSSMEGDSAKNVDLQNKRAASIVKVLEQQQSGSKIKYEVKTGNSWEIFRKQILLTNYYYLADSSPAQVNAHLNHDTVLLRKIEHLLSEERFATIKMKVAFDLKKLSEDDYWMYRFQHAIEKRDLKHALSNQASMINLLNEGKMNVDRFQQMKIPQDAKYISLLNNKALYLKTPKEKIDRFEELRRLSPDNPVVKYNYLVLKLNASADLPEDQRREDMQILASLYSSINTSVIPIKVQNSINARFFTITHEALKTRKPESYNNVKELSKNSPVLESITLADYYTDLKHFDIAAQILLDHVYEVDVNDKDLVKQYCLRILYNGKASGAVVFEKEYFPILKLLQKTNPDTFCEIFKQSKVSFKFFENLHLKKIYCDNCQPK
ncbi:MAG: hypothetical protein ACHQK8_01200 [Bacteroidia bacterium]